MRDASRFVLCKPHKWHVQEMGSGPVVLLIHGAGGATQSWRHLMPILARSFRTVAIDLPGQGFTKLGAQQRCGLDGMSADLLRLIMQEGWVPRALIGHSAGAAIALAMARMMEPVPKVVGINAALSNFKGVAGFLFPIMAKTLAALPGVAQLFTASTARPGSVARLIEGTGSNLAKNDRRHYEKLVSDSGHVGATLAMMAQWQLDGLLGGLETHPAEVLLMASTGDKAVPSTASRQAAARLPQGRYSERAGYGHLLHEEAAAEVAPEIVGFLQP